MNIIELEKKDNVKKSVQKGNFEKGVAFSVKAHLKQIFEKYSDGDDWEIKQQFVDLGLYYKGNDPQVAYDTAINVIGDCYDFFQLGKVREKIRTKKIQDDNERLEFQVMPLDPDTRSYEADSQITFFMNKQIKPGYAVVGLNIKPKFR